MATNFERLDPRKLLQFLLQQGTDNLSLINTFAHYLKPPSVALSKPFLSFLFLPHSLFGCLSPTETQNRLKSNKSLWESQKERDLTPQSSGFLSTSTSTCMWCHSWTPWKTSGTESIIPIPSSCCFVCSVSTRLAPFSLFMCWFVLRKWSLARMMPAPESVSLLYVHNCQH